MKRGLFTGFVIALTVLSGGLVHAQTGAGLMVLPWAGEEQLETTDDVYFFRAARTRDSVGNGVTLTRFVDQFRYRFEPKNEHSMVFGGRLVHMDIGTDFAGLPERLADHSLALGFYLGQNEDGWLTSAQVVAGSGRQ